MTRPNILILMVDQLNGTLFPDGPADWLHAPALKALAERSARFANAYTASPLCAPGRASFMSGACPPARGSMTTPPNSPPTSRPSPITCAARAIRPACRARCISSAPTSSTVSRSV
jgi:arylsulfatase A-like enzyme